jgi:undecaprenyl-diphosphatase
VSPRRFEWTAVAVAVIALFCFVWLASEVSSGSAVDFDATWRERVHATANPALTPLMRAVTLLGSQGALIGAAGASALILARSGRRAPALFVLTGLGGAELLLVTLKNFFQRARPVALFGDNLSTYSFPSGHALLSLSCYGVLAVFATSGLAPAARWSLRMAAALAILWIGLTRVYLGVHHPTDVIAGFLAGVVWLASLAAIYSRIMARTP